MAIRSSTESKLLDAADELFFTRGIAATPIDAVLARAGVSAATLYRGFASKEALVAAALERRHRDWLETWDRAVAAAADDEGRVLAVFDALDAFRARADGARWCAFLGSAAEYAEPPAELAAALRLDSDSMRERLTRFAAVQHPERAARIAEQLVLIVTGDLAMRLRAPGATTATARGIAAVLLAQD